MDVEGIFLELAAAVGDGNEGRSGADDDELGSNGIGAHGLGFTGLKTQAQVECGEACGR